MQIQADDYKYQIAEVNGKKFIVNSNGSIQHSNTEYKEDGDVLIDAKKASYDATNKQYKYATDVTSNVADIDLNDFVEGK